MKYIVPIFVGIISIALGGITVAYANDATYIPLAALPIGDGGSTPTAYTINSYLSGMIKLIIALGGGLAILLAIIGGTQYVASGAIPDAKSHALERVQNALTGLALILASYLILNSINPQLVKFNFMLPPVGITEPIVGSSTPKVKVGEPWPSDSVERARLEVYRIYPQRPTSCKTIGEKACTTLAGLGGGAMSGLITLRQNCASCGISITGGTEYWLHSANTAHRPGGNVVDLSIHDSALKSYVESNGTVVNSGCSVGTRYKIGSAIYVDERIANNPPHWHVCY